MRISFPIRVFVTAAAMLAAGCNLAPAYHTPTTPPSVAFKEAVPGGEAEPGFRVAAPKDAQVGTRWWEIYGDPRLNALEEQVAVSNQSVAAAYANYRAARALVAEAEASLYPTLSIDPSVTRSRSSASAQSFSSSTTTGTAATATGSTGTTPTTTTAAATTGTLSTASPRTLYSLPLEASYQLDLWGSLRNTAAENRFNALASASQVETALLSTQSTLAQDYFELRVTDEERRVLETTMADYRQSLRLVQTLYDNGLDSDEDLAQAQTQLATAEAQATDLGVARAQYEHAIAVLIGVPPSALSIPYRRLQQALPVPPVGVPSDLLERRADIATAERQVAAANAAIGVARAAYFPTLTLSGSAGYQSTALSTLFNWPNSLWSLGAASAQTLFDGGQRRAATANARALEESAVATYRQTVLAAFQSVEDNLASLRILSTELRQQHAAATYAQRAVKLSLIRFRNGVDSYVNVITAQNTFLTNRESELQVELKQLTASVNLVNNLGGGWSTADYDETVQTALHPPAAGDTHATPSDGHAARPDKDAAEEVGPPNPPALPDEDTRPDDFLQEDGGTASPRAR